MCKQLEGRIALIVTSKSIKKETMGQSDGTAVECLTCTQLAQDCPRFDIPASPLVP